MSEAPILLKPDKLNGIAIQRPVQDGVVQRGVFFPPTVQAHVPKQPKTIEELIEEATKALVPVVAQNGNLKKHQGRWMVTAALNERARIVRYLEQIGETRAAKALQHG